jgi:hypothetical protein
MMHAAEVVRNSLEHDPVHPHFMKTLDRCTVQLSIDLLDHELYEDYENAIIIFLVLALPTATRDARSRKTDPISPLL